MKLLDYTASSYNSECKQSPHLGFLVALQERLGFCLERPPSGQSVEGWLLSTELGSALLYYTSPSQPQTGGDLSPIHHSRNVNS